MRTKHLFLSVCCLLQCLVCFSQAKVIKEADVLYYTKQYKEAYSLYSKAYEKKKDNGVLLKMAECNYNIENYRVAQGYYAQYFTDTLFHAVPEYSNYANASRLSGKIAEALNLYRKINANGGDAQTRSYQEIFSFFLDTAKKVRVYDLDSVYTCVDLDASQSIDPDAAAMIYIWDFKDGITAEGIKVSHCFKSSGINKISLSIRDKATGFIRQNDTALTVYIEEPTVKFECRKKQKQYIYETYKGAEPYIYNHDILEYIWELGEGDYSLGKEARKQFNKLDYYTIKLTIIAKNKTDGTLAKYTSCRNIEVVDNYSDHSQKFENNLKGEK